MAKDINLMFDDAMEIMDDLNIEVDTIVSVSWNTRLRAVWGRCVYNRGTNVYKVELNPVLNDERVSWDAAMNTMIHEVLHAHKDRFCHTGEWKRCANIINRRYPNYHIERTTKAEDKNVADRMARNYKYFIKCTNCGSISKYQRESKIVRLVRTRPGSCKCGCGCTNLVLVNC